jgi:hypothetical protein
MRTIDSSGARVKDDSGGAALMGLLDAVLLGEAADLGRRGQVAALNRDAAK